MPRPEYDGPDLASLETKAREVGGLVASVMPDGAGFCLFVFSFGEGGWMTYVSNADRTDLVDAVREWLEWAEASLEDQNDRGTE